MVTANRATVRSAFAALVTTALEYAAIANPTGPVQKVYGYRVINWGTQSPIMAITEEGTEFGQLTNGGPLQPIGHTLAAHVFVFVPDDDAGSAEPLLSPIGIGLAGVVSANKKTSNWTSITIGGSTIESIKLQGREYLHETTPLTFR